MGKQIPYALLTLSAIFGFAVAWVLNQVWKRTFGAFFNWLGNLGLSIPIPRLPDVSIHPFGGLLKFNNEVETFLGGMVATAEHAMVRLFHQTISSFGALADELGALAQAVERRLENLTVNVAPRVLLAGLRALGLGFLVAFHSAEALALWVLRTLKLGWLIGLHSVESLVHKGLHALRLSWLVGLSSVKGLVRAGLKALGLAWLIGWRGFKSVAGFALRLVHVEEKLVGKGLRKTVHKGLVLLNLGWLFIDDVAHVAKWIGLQGPKAVIQFVKDALDYLVDVDICAIVGFTYDLAVIVEPIFHQLVGATEWICRHQGERLPSAVPDTPGYKGDWYPTGTVPPNAHPRLAPGFNLPILLRPVN